MFTDVYLIAVCKNISTEIGISGTATINAADLNDGSSDNCSIADFSASKTSFNSSDVGNNIVTLTVTDPSGNASTCNATVTVTQSVDRTTLLSSYTIIGTDAVSLKRNTVSNGGVGVIKAGAKATFDMSSVVTAPSTFAKADVIELKGGSTVTNKYTGKAVLTLPAIITNSYSTKKNLAVADNATVTVTDSVFAAITIGKNAKVTFTRPRIYAKTYEAKEGSTVNFSACTQVSVTDFITFRKNSKTNTDQRTVTFSVKDNSAGDEFLFESGVTFYGNAYATSGEIATAKATANAPSRLTGQFIAKKVTADENTIWNWNTTNVVCGPSYVAPAPSASKVATQPVVEEKKKINDEVSVSAFPNPFNATTTIRFISAADDKARLTIFNISGQEVETLFNGSTEAGSEYNLQFDGSNHPSGIYFYRLEANGKVIVNKLLLTK